MAFWKPGGKKPEAGLPLSAEVDRGGVGEGGRLLVYNRNESLALAAQRERLPIFKCRDAVLYLVETRATTVLVGQTGCGKTTQVPQYLVEAGWTAGGRMVACTQPRRVAAQTVAARVADEMGVVLGAEVGYAVRSRTSPPRASPACSSAPTASSYASSWTIPCSHATLS